MTEYQSKDERVVQVKFNTDLVWHAFISVYASLNMKAIKWKNERKIPKELE